MEIRDGWLASVRQVASPHFDARPAGQVNAIVIHCMSLPAGHFGGPWIEALFRGDLVVGDYGGGLHPDFADLIGLRVSAHVVIRRDGEAIQFVGFEDRAWHAGTSSYMGREAWNDFAIGIELEGTDTTPFTAAQYRVLSEVVGACRLHYGIASDWIVGHSDIAPGRKADPGIGFDWSRLR